MTNDCLGFTDVLDIKPKPMSWHIDGILPRGLGFIAGPPKAGNSPHGGKSMFCRYMLVRMMQNRLVLGRSVKPPMNCFMMINLDEPGDAIQTNVKGFAAPHTLSKGLLVCDAWSVVLPRKFLALENDIKLHGPNILVVDPLFRVLGGNDIRDNASTGPIIDRLRELERKYNLTIIVVHHSVKDPNRKKGDTSSWLNGSTDLNSAWDFCLCLEYDHKAGDMLLQCHFKYAQTREMRYESVKDAKGNIVDFALSGRTHTYARADNLLRHLQVAGHTITELSTTFNVSEATIKRDLDELVTRGEIESLTKKGRAPVWIGKKQRADAAALPLILPKKIGEQNE